MQELVKSIPEPTLRRLPLHYRLLKQLRDGRRAGGGH
jgi:NADH/NAD ratio-sensing transcriptional regulator Rex